MDQLEPTALSTFKQKQNAFLDEVEKLAEKRTVELVKWLEAPSFITALNDYDAANADDGVVFEDLVGNVIAGINSSPTGQVKIDSWIAEMKATPTNLLVRALAQNQTEAVEAVEAALEIAYGAPTPATEKAWQVAKEKVKWNKVADIGKKSLSFFNTNMKAINDATSGIDKIANTHGLDLILATTGHRLLRPLSLLGDTINEFALQKFLLLRAGVENKAALALVEAQIRFQGLEREELIARLRTKSSELSQASAARRAELGKRWKDLRVSSDVVDAAKGNYNAARDARIALVVALFEGLNLIKLQKKLSADPHDAKLEMQVAAAWFGSMSAFVDVASNLVKGVADTKDKALSYQALKVAGGALSIAGSLYGVYLDAIGGRKALAGGDYRMAMMLSVRSLFQGISAGLTLFTTLSYCSPGFEAFGKRVAIKFVSRMALASAERLLAWRAGLMLASLEVAIFIQGLTMVVTLFEPDALETWCSLSAFGKSRKKKGAYTSAEEQEMALLKALSDVA